MFSKQRQIRELQEKISELETQLRQQKAANAEELKSLKYQQELFQKKSQYMDGLLEEMQEKRMNAERELEQHRTDEAARLQQESQALRESTRRDIEAQVRAFSDSYNHYLSQLRLMMTILTQAAEKTGARFLQDSKTDAGRMMQDLVSSGLQQAAGGQGQAGVPQKNAAPQAAAAAASPPPDKLA